LDLECLNLFEDAADIDKREKQLALRLKIIINDEIIEINMFFITNNYKR
jgi:hypothetical protein